MNFSQLIDVLAGRWKLVVTTLLLLTAGAWAVSVLLPKRYTATVAVLVDARGVSALGNSTAELSQNGNQQVMATQADLVSSERVARRVVAQLNLQDDKALHERWLDEARGAGDAQGFIAQLLLKKLDVKPNRDSNVLNVAFTGGSPSYAMNVANAFARASIDTNLDLKVEPARQFAGWFDERIKTLRKDLETAQQKLTAYQRWELHTFEQPHGQTQPRAHVRSAADDEAAKNRNVHQLAYESGRADGLREAAAKTSADAQHFAALIEGCRGQSLDAHYLGYFECFHCGLFYEAHDVLEELWLLDRHGPDGDFYKGLIQLAGAFVHLQKHTEQRPRLRPSAALFKLARTNLGKYPPTHHHLDCAAALVLIEKWLRRLEENDFSVNPLVSGENPRLRLAPGGGAAG